MEGRGEEHLQKESLEPKKNWLTHKRIVSSQAPGLRHKIGNLLSKYGLFIFMIRVFFPLPEVTLICTAT